MALPDDQVGMFGAPSAAADPQAGNSDETQEPTDRGRPHVNLFDGGSNYTDLAVRGPSSQDKAFITKGIPVGDGLFHDIYAGVPSIHDVNDMNEYYSRALAKDLFAKIMFSPESLAGAILRKQLAYFLRLYNTILADPKLRNSTNLKVPDKLKKLLPISYGNIYYGDYRVDRTLTEARIQSWLNLLCTGPGNWQDRKFGNRVVEGIQALTSVQPYWYYNNANLLYFAESTRKLKGALLHSIPDNADDDL